MRAITQRALHLFAVLVVATFATFSLVDLIPGDAAEIVAGEGATEDQVDAVRERLGLNQPMLVRYGAWILNVLQGDLGRSYVTNQSVADTLLARFPVSLEIALVSQAIALAIAIPWALYSAYRENGWFDRIGGVLGFGGLATPSFVLGLVLIYIFAGGVLSIFPATGYVSFDEDPLRNLWSIALPVMCLVPAEAAVYRQVLRSDAISTLRENFVLMAKSKGLPPGQVLRGHVLRPSSLSLITIAGVSIGGVIGGTVIVETMFAVPGMGALLAQSVNERDFMMLQGALLVICVVYVVVNLLVDVGYILLDPRARNS
ncbi:ABC transporter permease [Microbacterium immunditiarum]|uniref:ABC transporter permease n=1 Tax=Microbacterium immunditiarum TaxID=337480 RepID=UPI001FE45952|nr:ABC transporter permease [Microbacterium immunditiarum]